jgi:hypothetical protein
MRQVWRVSLLLLLPHPCAQLLVRRAQGFLNFPVPSVLYSRPEQISGEPF